MRFYLLSLLKISKLITGCTSFFMHMPILRSVGVILFEFYQDLWH